jgi:large subunit ribosomal protein L30
MPQVVEGYAMTELYAIIRVRGSAETIRPVEDTLRMLNLTRVNHCVVRRRTKSLDGMLAKATGNITWGPIKDDVLERLVAKKGRLPGDRKLDAKQAREESKKVSEGKETSIKRVFRLHPPSGGYRAIKRRFPEGDLGPRGGKINDLLMRMI